MIVVDQKIWLSLALGIREGMFMGNVCGYDMVLEEIRWEQLGG